MINQEPQMVPSWIFCKQFHAISDDMWFLTAGPEVCMPMILTEFPQGKNCRSFFKKHNFEEKSNCLTYTVAFSFVCTSSLAVTTVVGFLETFTVSSSAEFRSFLLNMCMLALESTTNSLSSSFIAGWGW